MISPIQTLATEEKETNRIEAFSDGVFSIAITLLVLAIKVPQADKLVSGQSLIGALRALWPAFFSYLLSFATIYIMWIQHHRVFTFIRRADLLFIYLNGFLLLLVSFVPIPTAIFAEHIQHEHAKTSALLYTGYYVLIGAAYNFLWHYATYRRRLIRQAVEQKDIDALTREYYLGPAGFFLSFLLCFGHVALGIAACVGVIVFFAVHAGFKAVRP